MGEMSPSGCFWPPPSAPAAEVGNTAGCVESAPDRLSVCPVSASSRDSICGSAALALEGGVSGEV